MVSSKMKYILFGLIAVFLFAIGASAEETSSLMLAQGTATEAAAKEEGAADEIDYAIDAKIAAMSLKEKGTDGEEKVNEIRKAHAYILKKIEKSTEKKDIIALNHLNPILTSSKALSKIAEQSFTNLQEAVAKNDDKTGTLEYQKIVIVHGKEMILKDKADLAPSSEDTLLGEGTEVEVLGPEGGVNAPDITGVQPEAVTSGQTSSPGTAGDTTDTTQPDGESTDIDTQTADPLPIPKITSPKE